ncbi:MAG: DUF4157 domain-containing protein [Gammaproteobacteria bacterium]|nr:DUF4157 domain-containing protein [Gammaproteobacteria bacterium]
MGKQAVKAESAPPIRSIRPAVGQTFTRHASRVSALLSTGRHAIQPMVEVGSAGDAAEREADSMAERVLRIAERKPSEPTPNRELSAEPRRVPGASTLDNLMTPRASELFTSVGKPLDATTRSFFQSGFGYDLGRVRVHTDPISSTLAGSIKARAFTVGTDLVFNRDQYDPASIRGKKLLAHELAHVVQQQSTGLKVQRQDDSSAQPDVESISAELSESQDRLAQDTAMRINQLIEDGFDQVIREQGTQPFALLGEVEQILREVTELRTEMMGKQPVIVQEPLSGSGKQALRYYLPAKTHQRLAILLNYVSLDATYHIQNVLLIDPATKFTYEMQLVGAGGGKGIVGVKGSPVYISYLEDGKEIWKEEYNFEGMGPAIGVAPMAATASPSKSPFTADFYWGPGEFVGKMDLAELDIAPLGGYSFSGATLTGQGNHPPVSITLSGWIASTPGDVGVGKYWGYLNRELGEKITDPGSTQQLPEKPAFVQEKPVNLELLIGFDTDSDQPNDRSLLALEEFVQDNQTVLDQGDFDLQLFGQASRIGEDPHNQALSERRIASVVDLIEALWGRPVPDEKIQSLAVGERQAAEEGVPPGDDSSEYRTVELRLIGEQQVVLPHF